MSDVFNMAHWGIPQWIVLIVMVLGFINTAFGASQVKFTIEQRLVNQFVTTLLLLWGGFFK